MLRCHKDTAKRLRKHRVVVSDSLGGFYRAMLRRARYIAVMSVELRSSFVGG